MTRFWGGCHGSQDSYPVDLCQRRFDAVPVHRSGWRCVCRRNAARNSVGTAQLRRNAVTKSKIKDGAVTSAKVKDGSLQAKDFKSGQLVVGPRGPAGAPGQQGAPGAPATKLWANVQNSFGTPTLVRGSGATGVFAKDNGQIEVTFNRDVTQCSYQATGWLNSTSNGGATYADAPIMIAERGSNTNAVAPDTVNVQAYVGGTGALDTSGNYSFNVAVFC